MLSRSSICLTRQTYLAEKESLNRRRRAVQLNSLFAKRIMSDVTVTTHPSLRKVLTES
jgi:hypothetical protein